MTYVTPCSTEMFVKNPHLKSQPGDYLYHLGFGNTTHNLEEMFGDVKFVCLGGTKSRMENFANTIQKVLDIKLPTGVVCIQSCDTLHLQLILRRH